MSLRYHVYRARYNYGRQLDLKRPVDVSLELSSLCNMHCGYCYHSDPKNLPFSKKFMDVYLAFNILDQAADLGANSVKLNWRGESTLHPSFYMIAKKAKSLARGSTFIDRLSNSNFKFKTERDGIFEGLCFQTKVKVSFDSFVPGVLEKQRAGAIYDLIFKNIDKFYNYPGRDNILVIQAVRTKLNKDEDIEGQVKKHWPSALVSIREVVEGRKDDNIDDFVNTKRDDSVRTPCKQAYVRLVFDHTGIAYPCCVDWRNELPLGDIKHMCMDKIFNGYIARKLRKDLISGAAFQKTACMNCSSFESYKNFNPNWNS